MKTAGYSSAIVAGTKLTLRPGFGSQDSITAYATEAPTPHKSERAFSYRREGESEASHWAYVSQVTGIISQPTQEENDHE